MTYRLTIYADDARIVLRETSRATRRQALRSRDAFERRHGRHCHVIDMLPSPAAHDAAGWDDYRRRHGLAAH